MFKSILSSFTLSAALAAPAAAQLGQFPNAAQQTSRMYWQQVNAARIAYAYDTGYDGLAPSWQNPNSVYYSNGLGVVPAWSVNYPGPVPCNGPIVIGPSPYGGGCFPGGGFNSTSWGIGINAGVGGSFGGGYGGGSWGVGIGGGIGQTIYGDNSITTWGIGANVGVGGGWGGW